ncbi:MAG: 4Fe-4S binding protein [Desulfobacterales bacterium]|nr:4Fe-4S binding protein [Desulfobacterales bacterium]
MKDPIYRTLQQRLDTYSMGFPSTESGIEINILEKLFSIEDADLFLNLSPQLETPDQVAARMGKPIEETAQKLGDMADRGLLFSLKKADAIRYGAIPFVHGLFEFQINKMDKELARIVRQYMDEEFKDAMSFSLSNFLRVIPVHKTIESRPRVAAYEDAMKVLEKANPIVISDCACRKSAGLIDQACDKPVEVCFMLGSMGKYYLDHDMGRQIDLKEAGEILSMAHDAGLVTQPATSQNPSGMCNCCGDCCGPLTSLKDHPKPAQMVFSNHFAQVDPDLCTSCGTCEQRCQINAFLLDDTTLAKVDLDRCIGCGLCITTCPEDAIELIRKSDDQFQVPPETSFEQMMTMAQKRGVI